VSPPIATIIVVTYNSARWLARQRAALEAQTETRWRLVVFDNASRPDERPKVRDLAAGGTIIQSELNIGFAAGNNAAARDADTPYLVFLNPDAFPEPDWLAALIRTAERFPLTAAIGSTQVRADHGDVFDGTGDVLHASGLAYRSNYGKRRGATPPLGETFAACAAAMLVRREAFETVGGFDESYFAYFEDVELGFRLRLAGWAVLQSPEAIVAHVGGGAPNERSGFADFHGARNRMRTFVKCMPAPLLWPLLPAHLLANAIACTFALRRGWHAWQGYIAALGEVGAMWRARRGVNRIASTGAIARALAWSPFVFFGRKPVIRPIR
jgi:N-acetylglucosaminyl-diphospho-decaprenol L-rhamnosyltransferase